MALNPQYDAIGKGFVQQYYTLFDDPAQRPNLVNMYNVSIFSKYSMCSLKKPFLLGRIKFLDHNCFFNFEVNPLLPPKNILFHVDFTTP